MPTFGGKCPRSGLVEFQLDLVAARSGLRNKQFCLSGFDQREKLSRVVAFAYESKNRPRYCREDFWSLRYLVINCIYTSRAPASGGVPAGWGASPPSPPLLEQKDSVRLRRTPLQFPLGCSPPTATLNRLFSISNRPLELHRILPGPSPPFDH